MYAKVFTKSSNNESSQTESSQTESNHIESSQTELDEDDPGNLYTNASSEAVQVTYSENLLNVILIFY
jgi:hypothetical protein